MLERQTVLVSVRAEWRGRYPDQASVAQMDNGAPGRHRAAAEQWVTGCVTAISHEGCGLMSPLALAPELPVWIIFPGFQARAAKVASVKDDLVDCNFIAPLPVAILDYLLRMSDPAARG